MPSASSTSAEPERDDCARLPCLATVTPAAATTSAAMVDILMVPRPSPPVPQVSTSTPAGTLSLVARARIARAAPTTSLTVSPFMRSATSNAPICAGVEAPSMIVPITPAISSAVRSARETARAMAAATSIKSSRGNCRAAACPRA